MKQLLELQIDMDALKKNNFFFLTLLLELWEVNLKRESLKVNPKRNSNPEAGDTSCTKNAFIDWGGARQGR